MLIPSPLGFLSSRRPAGVEFPLPFTASPAWSSLGLKKGRSCIVTRPWLVSWSSGVRIFRPMATLGLGFHDGGNFEGCSDSQSDLQAMMKELCLNEDDLDYVVF